LLIALAAAFCFGVSFAIWRLHQMLRVRYYVTIALEEWPILALSYPSEISAYWLA